MAKKWFETKENIDTLRKSRLMTSEKGIKQSASLRKLKKRAELLDKPSVMGISTSGLNMKAKDVKSYIKENNLKVKYDMITRG